jgi:type 1 fimbriae regulatory protein FimB/type 1 fimbriae regulatory protein FimE
MVHILTTAHKKYDKCKVSNAKRRKMAAISALKLVAPANKKRTVAVPRRKRNADYRSREHLTEREVERLIEAAKDNRRGHRDATMVFLAFRHGLRASELIDLRWEQVDLENGILHVRRVKQGTPATHPLTGRELRALRRLQREAGGLPFVFVSERGAPFTNRGFQAMVERAGKAAGFTMKIHPHMLRHACGYKLANDGVDTRTIQGYLGHKSIQHTVRYTELSPTRFKSLFRD